MTAVPVLLRLNLGAGAWRPAGYMTADISVAADFQLDLARQPWPWGDQTVGEILASHVLEHFDKAGGRAFLAECHRILAPGGRLALAVPDLDRFITARLTGDWAPLDGYAWTDLNDLLGGGAHEHRPEQRHRYMYTFESLAYTLERLGFTVRRRGPAEWDNPAYRAISLYLDAWI